MQNETQFSDGTLRLIGLLWSLIEQGGSLLLEEPELSLHPAVVARLPQIFARAVRTSGRQTLVTTHSEALLSDKGIGLHEVFLLEPAEEGTEVVPAQAIGEAVLPRVKPERAERISLFDA